MPMTPLLLLLCNPAGVRIAAAESLNSNLGKVREWCDF